jgi:hypothetical protein
VTKEEFFSNLEEIITDPLSIGSREQETNNMWCISTSSELAKTLTIDDLSAFIDRVISNRKEQIKSQKSVVNMLFYLWFDEQASQIRFNVISDDETGLLFGCEIIPINDYTPIIESFLGHPYHDGIPLESGVEIDFDEGKEFDVQEYSLKVYCIKL